MQLDHLPGMSFSSAFVSGIVLTELVPKALCFIPETLSIKKGITQTSIEILLVCRNAYIACFRSLVDIPVTLSSSYEPGPVKKYHQ